MDAKKNILVIDDEEGIRDLLTLAYGTEGFTVVTACDGREGIEVFKKGDFGLVFLDVNIPKVWGPEVVKAIRKIKPGQKIVLSSGSAESPEEIRKIAEGLGVYKCLVKPFEIKD